MNKVLTYLRNIFTLIGLVGCMIAAANIHYEWYYNPVLESYGTTAPFIIAFNFHVLLNFISHWHERFSHIEKNALNNGLKNAQLAVKKLPLK